MRIKITVNHPRTVTVHDTVLNVGKVKEICWGWEFEDNSLSFDGFVTDRAGKTERYIDKILTMEFLTRILDTCYFVGNDDNHVVYSDSDGLKEVTIEYSSDVLYAIFLTKTDVTQIINYLRDNYNFFYDPNRKEPEDEIMKLKRFRNQCKKAIVPPSEKESDEDLIERIGAIQKNLGGALAENRELRASKTDLENDVKGLSLKVEELEDALKQACLHNNSDNADKIMALNEAFDWKKKHLITFNKLINLRLSILQVYREIFDCSNGDPEGTDMENLTDILTEYQRVLKLKDDAERENDKWRRCIAEILGMNEGSSLGNICIRIRMIKHDKDNVSSVLKLLQNDIRGAYTEVFPADADDKHWFAYDRQAVTDIVEALKRERALKETAEEKAVRYKEELRSVNESFEYQTLELCKILGLDAGSPPEDILEAVEDIIRHENEAQKVAGARVMDIGKLCEELTAERKRAEILEDKFQDLCDVLGVIPAEDNKEE